MMSFCCIFGRGYACYRLNSYISSSLTFLASLLLKIPTTSDGVLESHFPSQYLRKPVSTDRSEYNTPFRFDVKAKPISTKLGKK